MVFGVVSGGRGVEGAAARVTTIALDARVTRRISVGMRAYMHELTERLPRVAPEFSYRVFDRGRNFGLSEQIGLPLAIARSGADLTHFLSFYAPVFPARPFVVTVHDLIHLRFPRYFKRHVGFYYQTVTRALCARAARVITDDPRTVDDLERFLGVPRTKVRTIALGVDDRFLTPAQPYRAERPYLLYVGNHRAHKNLATLFDAWSSLAPEVALDLYVTGDDDFGGELERRSTPVRRIVALGDIATDRLPEYYAGALALVHPALCEGFGLPMLEAMAAGTPVIASDDAVPQVLAHNALRFATRDAAALRVQMERIVGNPALRGELVERGRTLAARLTWDACARATADVYREVLEESEGS